MNLFEMVRRIKQKVLFTQIFAFLNDPKYCTGHRDSHEEWLLEFTCHTKAKEAHQISFKELEDFRDWIFNQESSEFRRLEAAKVLRKFFRFCILKRYMTEVPDGQLKATTEDDKIDFMNKIVTRRQYGPLPNIDMIKKVRELKNKQGMNFREIVRVLTQETGKKQHLATVSNWYNNKRI